MYEDEDCSEGPAWYEEILEARREANARREEERDYSEDCIPPIRDSISKSERIRLANSFGKNWACIISGCGDQ